MIRVHSKSKMLLIIVIATCMVFVLAGCGGTQDSSPDKDDTSSTEDNPVTEENGSSEEPADDITIGMVIVNQEALFFTDMVKGAEEEAKNAGVELVVHNANNKPIEQNNAIENFVQQGVDAIIVSAIDVNGIIPAMGIAADAGIPVVSVDAIVESEFVDTQIGVDNEKASIELGQYFNDFVKENYDGKVKLGIVGALNSYIQNVRQDGFTDEVEKESGTEILDVVDGKNVQEDALAAAENLLTGNPDLQAVFATGEPALIGTAAAVKSQNKADSVKVFGWDLSKQAIEGIDAGWVEAVVQQHPENYGKESVSAAIKLVQGEEVADFIDVPATIVTKENVDDFRALFE